MFAETFLLFLDLAGGSNPAGPIPNPVTTYFAALFIDIALLVKNVKAQMTNHLFLHYIAIIIAQKGMKNFRK